ncbi:unnamed protein product [Echinostoma caproni]|uniref:Uncharacterized protein n=1 Tax=Echinostoma caproni TaxID=27848 RepID=A0A183ALR7_9TREM|nr:unnamed protein product [Echinostoma caproni]
MNVPFNTGQRNSCSLCQENCASLVNNSCPKPLRSSPSSTVPPPPQHVPSCSPDDRVGLINPSDLPLLNSDTQSVLPGYLDTVSNQNAHLNTPIASLPISCLSVSNTRDHLSKTDANHVNNVTNETENSKTKLIPDSGQTRLRLPTEQATATIHQPCPNPCPSSPTRTKRRSSSFKLTQNLRNGSNKLVDYSTHNVTVRHRSDTSLHNPFNSIGAPSANLPETSPLDKSSGTRHRCFVIRQSTTETAIDRNEEINLPGHVTVQRAGSVPNESSSAHPYGNEATADMRSSDTAPVALKRGSIVNGTGDVGADRRKSRQTDNTTELLARRTLNGGSTLSLTADPRSRTCCFCWCCCCSCSCMRVRANLQDSKRPSASLDPQSRLDEISADEK